MWRDAYKHEVDFIDTNNGNVIPIEVKYKSKIRKQDYNNLYLFSKKFKSDKVIMLSNTIVEHHNTYKEIEIEIQSVFK